MLYVADSEGSSIRAVPFDPRQPVVTVVGTQWSPIGRLFLFGDVDGGGQLVRLQHALGVAYHDGKLYVADTYNNKIKVVDPVQKTSTTLVGLHKPGSSDDPPQFDEPAGLSYAAGKLYVADTNNHAIRTIDLESDNQVKTLEIAGLEPPADPQAQTKPSFPDAEQIKLPAAQLKPDGGKVRLRVELSLPAGYKINPIAPLRYLIESDDAGGPVDRQVLGVLQKVKEPAASFDIELPATASDKTETLSVSLAYYYCQHGSEGLCKAGSVVWSLPVSVTDAGEPSVTLPVEVKD